MVFFRALRSRGRAAMKIELLLAGDRRGRLGPTCIFCMYRAGLRARCRRGLGRHRHAGANRGGRRRLNGHRSDRLRSLSRLVSAATTEGGQTLQQ